MGRGLNLCKWMPGGAFHAPLGKQRRYRYLSWIVHEDTGCAYRRYRTHRWPWYFNLCVCVWVFFFVLNSEQWHLELFRRGRSHPAWVRSRVDSCVSYTRGRRLCLFFFPFLCKCVFVFFEIYFGLSMPIFSLLFFLFCGCRMKNSNRQIRWLHTYVSNKSTPCKPTCRICTAPEMIPISLHVDHEMEWFRFQEWRHKKIKFVKLWDLSGYSERTTFKRPFCQKLALCTVGPRFVSQMAISPGGGGSWVNFCWVCAAGLSEPPYPIIAYPVAKYRSHLSHF